MHILPVLGVVTALLPEGTAENPSLVTPLELTGEPVAIWWDAENLHVGDDVHSWRSLNVEPKNGAKFTAPLPKTKFREANELRGEIARDAPRCRIGSFGRIGNAAISNEVTIVAAKDMTVNSHLYATGETQDYTEVRETRRLKAGEKSVIRIVGLGSSSGFGHYALRDAGGRNLCRFTGAYRDPKLMFDYKTIRAEAEKDVLVVRTAGWTDDDGYTMRIGARDLLSDTIEVWAKTVALGRIWGEKRYPVDVSDMLPGFYRLHFDYYDAAGRLVHSDNDVLMRPGKKMPWEGTTLGADDTVPPPWTKPSFGEDGEFECWQRKIRLGGKGLVESIVNKGEEFLTAPIALTADGTDLTFDVKLLERKVSEAKYLLTAREDPVTVEATCEFDGYVRFDAKFPTSVKSLVWRVHASRKHATGFDDCSSEKNPNACFRPGTNPSFAVDVSRYPAWWMPGVRGLMGGVLSLRGWHQRSYATAERVESTADEIRVTTAFVDGAMAAGPDRTVSFYIEPTPVKPKDLALASLDQEKRVHWTGHVFRHFETKYPGFEDPVLIKRFTDMIRRGQRVFWYNATIGASPSDPFWPWYAADWNMKGLDYWAHEAPKPGKREKGHWGCACQASKGFHEFKIFCVNHYLNGIPEAKDLYFDLAAPERCFNEKHGCRFKDDFGVEVMTVPIAAVRDLHKRAYWLVKAKNADGVLEGHTLASMTPANVFFDMITACEGVAYDVLKNGFTYYDIYTPEVMQSFYVPRVQEYVFNVSPQFSRCRECWAPHLYKSYDPETDPALPHLIAYLKIHDLNISAEAQCRHGTKCYKVDSPIRALRGGGTYSAYYMNEAEPPVTLSSPGPRQLWAWFAKGKDGVLIVLNDTDEAMKQTVAVKGLSAKGTELLDGTAFDFASGSCALDLGPRGAKFIRFK